MTLASVSRYDGDKLSRDDERAIVVGGSISGLLTARVLADRFEEVIVVERDANPDGRAERPGVPQANHVHGLLEAGRATLEDLFSGYGEALLSEGGVLVDASTDLKYYEKGDFLATGPERLPMYCASRPLFEQVIRRFVTDFDGVTFRFGSRCTDYLVDDAATTVEGVVVRDDDAGEVELAAQLVVDATGRTSRTPSWLEKHGYASPPVDEVQVDVAYGTTTIERPPDDRRAYLISPSSPRTRGGFVAPIEGDCWQVTLQGLHGDEPPSDPQGFTEFAGSLPVPDLKELLDSHSWVSDEVHQYPFPSSLRRRYEDLDRFPEGLVVVGDAVASFNPVYGQGMSVAAMNALLLHHALVEGGLEDLAPRFFDRVGNVVDDVWRMAVSSDFEFSQTEGPKPQGADVLNRYLSRLVRSAHSDGTLADTFLRVLRLEQPPTVLLRPSVVMRTLLPTP